MRHESVLMGAGSPYAILPAALAAQLGIPPDAHTLRDELKGLPPNTQRMHLARVLGVASRRTEAAEEVGVLYNFLLDLSPHTTDFHWDPWQAVRSVYAVLSA